MCFCHLSQVCHLYTLIRGNSFFFVVFVCVYYKRLTNQLALRRGWYLKVAKEPHVASCNTQNNQNPVIKPLNLRNKQFYLLNKAQDVDIELHLEFRKQGYMECHINNVETRRFNIYNFSTYV